MEKLTEFDMAEYLDTEELQQGYLDYNAKQGSPEDLLRAINTVARARGMTKTAKEAGITRDGLYKALSPDGNPAFSTAFPTQLRISSLAFSYRFISTPP